VEDDIKRTVEISLDNWDAIGVEELDGVLYMPATIKRRSKVGGVVEVPVMLRGITGPHRIRCRTAARTWALNADLDLDRDSDLVGELESYSILAFAIRDPEPPYIQHVVDGPTLFERYDNPSLDELWGRYDAWHRMLHPDFGKYDAEQMWQIIAAIKAGADITPLAAMPGVAQATCMLVMAQAACSSPTAPSWVRSLETSTPES